METPKVITVTHSVVAGPYTESLTDSIVQGGGAAADAGKAVFTGANGLIDPSLIPETGSDVTLPLPATEVSYDNTTYPTVEAALNFLLYVPLQLAFYNSGNEVELGTALGVITLGWAINKTIVSQSINQGIGTLPATQRSYAVNYPAPGLTGGETWTLTVSDGTKTSTATTTVSFLPKAYWGVSPNTTLTNAEILSFGGQSLATALGTTITYNATGGNYPYYCYPVTFGKPSKVVVGGLTFTAYSIAKQPVTNAQGFTQSYYILSFTNLQNGNDIVVAYS